MSTEAKILFEKVNTLLAGLKNMEKLAPQILGEEHLLKCCISNSISLLSNIRYLLNEVVEKENDEEEVVAKEKGEEARDKLNELVQLAIGKILNEHPEFTEGLVRPFVVRTHVAIDVKECSSD